MIRQGELVMGFIRAAFGHLIVGVTERLQSTN